MIRILICDDEGIVQESLKFMIQKSFGDKCEIESAKNGRIAIELAESFHPDIVLMDIQMPGINGIEAMQEIRKENKNIVFIVLTAYDKFEYSQKSIDIGVLSYLTKPINRDVLIETLRKAMKLIRERKEKVKNDLEIKEKLEVVIPMIENGFVYSVLFDGQNRENSQNYRELLNIEVDYGYALVIECGDELHKGVLSNTLGAGIRLQKHYMILREMLKETTGGIVGDLVSNKVIVLVPCDQETEEYQERVAKIDSVRSMLRKLEQQLDLKFKAGIGSVKTWNEIRESYQEALDTERQGVGKVTHARDLPMSCVYEDSYPVKLEKELFAAVEEGNQEGTRERSRDFAMWLMSQSTELSGVVRLKAMEFVLWAEHLAYMQGGMLYRFQDREGYLETLLSFQTYEELTSWFVQKMVDASRHIAMKQQEKTSSVVERAKEYITVHFSEELSLDEMAKELGISPYYLSKLFKETVGVNYIDYLTSLRMRYAKEQLSNSDKSIKEICHESGYGDPNYFSRIFKKWTGVTPTEYREGRMS